MTPNREPRGLTEDFIEETGANYPYAYLRGSDLKRATGQRGFPHAALIDPSGKIVWTGHPSRLTEGLIEKHLAGASKFITFGWPDAFEPVAKELSDLNFGRALKELEKLATEEKAGIVRSDLMTMVSGRLKAMEEAYAGGDYLAANDLAERLDSQLKGLPEAERVQGILAKLKSDKDAKRVMKAQVELRKLMDSKLAKRKDVEKAMKKAKRMLAENDGNIVGDQAADFIAKLRNLLLAL